MAVLGTGQQPKRQKLREVAQDPDKARLLMGQYLSGSIPSPPWEAMGLSRPPVIGGKPLLSLSPPMYMYWGPRATYLIHF